MISTVTNGEDGEALFDEVAYTESDIGETYTYVIHETGSDGDGVTVKDIPWTIEVRVDDEGEGVLTPTVTRILKDGEEVWNSESAEESAPAYYEFDNTYEAECSLVLRASKTLTGRELKDGEFVFAILDEEGLEVAAGTNDADGRIVFTAIEYTLEDVGTHEYTVCEKKNGLGGVIYDELQWKLVTEVTDLGDGHLQVTFTTGKIETP